MSTGPPDPVHKEYARLARVYDRRWPEYTQGSIRETLARANLQPTDRILDVGCGTGALLNELHQRFPQGQLMGVDLVPEMIEVARRKLPSLVQLQQAKAEELPFPDGSFHVLFACSVFHYFREPLRALHEFNRVLRHQGQLIITDWCTDFLTCRLCDQCLRLFSRAHFRGYGQRELLQLLKDAGSPSPRVEAYKLNWFWGMMTAQAVKP